MGQCLCVTPMASVCFLVFSTVFISNSYVIANNLVQNTSSGPYFNHNNETINTDHYTRNQHKRALDDDTVSTTEIQFRNEDFSSIYDIITRTIINKTDEKLDYVSENDEMEDTEYEINFDYNESEPAPCSKSHSIIISNYTLFDNESLLDLDKNILYPPDYFWTDVDKNNNTKIRGCICLLKSCVRKCCPEGRVFLDNNCISSNMSLLYPFELKYIDVDTYDTINDTDADVHLIYGNPCKGEAYVLNPSPDFPEDMYYLLNTGILFVPAIRNHTLDDFCMEAFEEYNQILPLVCITEDDVLIVDKPTEQTLLNPIGMIISLPFLLLTFMVYAVLSELKNLHGLCLMSYVGCLFIAYTILAIVQLGGRSLAGVYCKICGKL